MPLTFGAPSGGWPNFAALRAPRLGSTYLAGPMRGYERFNFPAFDAAAKQLRAEGWDVRSPAEMDRLLHGPEIEFTEGSEITPEFMHNAMRRDIKTLLDVDAIHLLPGWRISTGANLERAVADAIGLQVWEKSDDPLTPWEWVRVA